MQTANGLAASYAPGAYRRDATPVQEPLKNISRFAKSLEAGDFIERLPWGDYAGLDMHVLPQYVKNYQKKLESGGVGWVGPKWTDRKSTRLNSSHVRISYAVFCLKKKSVLTACSCSITSAQTE